MTYAQYYIASLPFIKQVIQPLPVFNDFCLLRLNGRYHESLGSSQTTSLTFKHFHFPFNDAQVSLQVIVFSQKRLDTRKITPKILAGKCNSLEKKVRRLSKGIFERCTSNGSESFSAFNMPWRYQICIPKYRDDLPANLVKITPQNCKNSTSGWCASIKNVFAKTPW